MDAQHAAFTKVIENVMRYQGITFANSLSLAFPQFDMRHILRLPARNGTFRTISRRSASGATVYPLRRNTFSRREVEKTLTSARSGTL